MGTLRVTLTYELVLIETEVVGYLAYECLHGGSVLHLNKLYLTPELHGQGLGQELLGRVEAVACDRKVQTVPVRLVDKGAPSIARQVAEDCVFKPSDARRSFPELLLATNRIGMV